MMGLKITIFFLLLPLYIFGMDERVSHLEDALKQLKVKQQSNNTFLWQTIFTIGNVSDAVEELREDQWDQDKWLAYCILCLIEENKRLIAASTKHVLINLQLKNKILALEKSTDTLEHRLIRLEIPQDQISIDSLPNTPRPEEQKEVPFVQLTKKSSSLGKELRSSFELKIKQRKENT